MAKSKSKKEFVLTVVALGGDRGGDETPQLVTYRGKSQRDVLIEIIEVHGYGFDREEDAEDPATIADLKERILDSNGDGCDYILAIFKGKPQSYMNIQ